ncbi:MAG: hypothetical protein A2464_03155 [Deltaproteobacteria bacterium RIFOXYC2_FULL_48_10]|nr:MAG: hypothetical protein A2464_03155 [Deltaproteobacteria bacterium RIFOXYC2_FULL_48_10]
MKRLRFVVFCFVLMVAGQGRAQDLIFSEILTQALVHSYDLKTAGLEKEIRQERLAEAGAMYFPTLSLGFTNEYIHDLGNDAAKTVSVGETLIPGNESTFQHSLALSGQYLLYDFGVQKLKYGNAERDIVLAQHAVAQRLIDLKIEVLSLFGTGVRLQKKIETWSALLGHRKEVYEFTRRLVASGSRDKPEQGIAAISVADALQNCEALQMEMIGVIEKLAFFTGKSYSLAEVRFMDFPDQAGAAVMADGSKLPEIRAYDVAIEQKKAEVDIALRHWLPRLSLYSSFRMYGDDRTDFVNSLDSLEEKNAAIGLVVSMNLFNGFSDAAKARRLQKEMEKLKIEKEKKTAEDEQKLNTLARKDVLSEQGLGNAGTYRLTLNDQETMGERLSGQQIIDRISLLQQKEAQMEKHLVLTLAEVERRMNVLQLQMLAEGAI